MPGVADAGEPVDAGPLLTRGPVRVITAVSSTDSAADGGVEVNPPALALPGDLVALMLLRADGRAPFTAEARGWRREFSNGLGSGLEQVNLLWRVAAADEPLDRGRYAFEAPGGAWWALFVFRGASGLVTHESRDGSPPISFTAASGSPGDLVIDLFAPGNFSDCFGPDGGMPVTSFGRFKVAIMPVDASGVTPAVSMDCGLGAGNVSQLRVFAAP